ncbi:MAG: hypothetical protein WCA20_36180 [Candidatus Sulfotelmatobacter sp.]
MSKGYVQGLKNRKEPPEEPDIVDVWFTNRVENAASYATRSEAEAECLFLERWRVKIPTATGHKHTCTDFKVEERATGQFVLFCEAPFVVRGEALVN